MRSTKRLNSRDSTAVPGPTPVTRPLVRVTSLFVRLTDSTVTSSAEGPVPTASVLPANSPKVELSGSDITPALDWPTTVPDSRFTTAARTTRELPQLPG